MAAGVQEEPKADAGGAAPHRASRMPFSQILAFTVTNLAQGVMLTMPFTVAVYMVRAFLAADAAAAAGGGGFSTSAAESSSSDEARIGRLTGLLASVYSFSQFTTSYAWGVFSSRRGRKPVMVLGSAASSVTLLLFGLAGSFSTAAAARVVAGLLNGIIVAWKSSIGESCDALEQGRILSYMSLSWGIGCILGPSIGGLTSAPCTSMPGLPGCQPGGLLQIRPYFLPCAISSAINLLALCLNVLVLKETLPHLVAARTQQQQLCSASGSASSSSSRMSQLLQAAGRRIREVLGQRRAGYGRVGSQVDASNTPSSSSISSCGPGCTGCSVCWQLWRAESGVGSSSQQRQQEGDVGGDVGGVKGSKQQVQLRPLLHEDSAGSLQLSTFKHAQQQDQQQHIERSNSSVSDSPGPVPPLRPNDSASEHTLRQYRVGGGAKQQQGRQLGSLGDQQPVLLSQPSLPHQQQQVSTTGSTPRPHAYSIISSPTTDTSSSLDQFGSTNSSNSNSSSDDCTIIVSSTSSPPSSQHTDNTVVESAQPDAAPLLQKQPSSSTTPITNTAAAAGDPSPAAPSLRWYKRREVVLVLLAYGTVCLLFCAIDELTPIFASAPRRQGGLHLSELQLAPPLSFSGACLIVVSLFAFPAAQRTWGTLAVTRAGLCIAVLTALAIPTTSFLAAPSGSGSKDIGAAAWGLLYTAMLLKALAGCFAFTGTMITVNTSVSDPQQLGEVNGVGQSLASLARGVGPAMGGLMWGITVHLQGHVAGAQLLPFACVAGTAVVALLLYAFVRPADGVEVELGPQKGTSCCQE